VTRDKTFSVIARIKSVRCALGAVGIGLMTFWPYLTP
jgi:hypothetical protein